LPPEAEAKNPSTVRDIAKRAGVSIGTVSRALKNQPGVGEATRAHILRVAREMGYDLGSLRPAKLRRVSFLHRQHYSPASNSFYAPVLHGVEEACRRAGLVLSLSAVSLEDSVFGLLQRHGADGLICVGYFEPELLEGMRQSEVPVVLVDHWAAGLPSVNSNNLGGSHAATAHLIAQGLRRIAFIAGELQHYSIGERLRGYRQALWEAHLPADPTLEVTRDPPDREQGTVPAVQRLLALPKPPEAIVAYNDATALQAIRVCQGAGLRVPGDIAIVGFDDLPAAEHSHPPLTTVRVDKELLGRTGVELLLRPKGEIAHLTVPAELIVRQSSVVR